VKFLLAGITYRGYRYLFIQMWILAIA